MMIRARARGAMVQFAAFALMCAIVLFVVGSIQIEDGRIAWRPPTATSNTSPELVTSSSSAFTVAIYGKETNIIMALSRYSFESLLVAVPSLLVTFFASLLFAGLGAMGSTTDRSVPLYVLSTLPVFLVAYLLQVAAIWLNGVVPGLTIRVAFGGGARRAFVLPILALTLALFFYASRTMQTYTRTIRKMPFTTFALSLGYSNRQVVARQILPGTIALFRASLSTFIQIAFFNLFVIERVFNVPGLSIRRHEKLTP